MEGYRCNLWGFQRIPRGMLSFSRVLDSVYKATKINMLAHEGGRRGILPSGLNLVKKEDFLGDARLRSAMEEARHWNGLEMVRRRMLGDTCYMVLDGERCVHYSWLSQRTLIVSEMGYEASLIPGNFWIYNSYTSPSHRGRSIFPEVLLRMLGESPIGKGGAAWAGVLDTNTASMRGLSKAGFEEAFVLRKKTFLSSTDLFVGRRTISARLTRNFDEMRPSWIPRRWFGGN